MHALFRNKNFLKSFERIILVVIGGAVFSFMLWKAPDQAQRIVDAAGLLFVGTKLK